MREFRGVGRPVTGILPNILKTTSGSLRVRAFSALPAIVQLKEGDAHACGTIQFCQTESLIYFGILATVAPGIEHNHLILCGSMMAQLFLIEAQGSKRFLLAAGIDAGNASINAGPAIRLYIMRRNAQPHYHKIAKVRHEVRTRIM